MSNRRTLDEGKNRYKAEHRPFLTIGLACQIFALVFFFFLVTVSFGMDQYLVRGNLHDLFIPFNSALAVEQGLQFHENFHSPFGFIYHHLNYYAIKLIESFPSHFTVMDTILLTSVFTFVVFCLFYTLIQADQDMSSKIPFWAFLTMSTMMFQLRDSSSLLSLVPYWYGVYNHQLWAFLLLQAIYTVRKSESLDEGHSVTRFALVQAGFLIFALNYKISFFLGSGALCVAAITNMTPSQTLRYLSTGAIALVASVAVASLAGYSYLAYFGDLTVAADAKSSIPGNSVVFSALHKVLVFFLLLQCLRYYSDIFLDSEKGFWEKYCQLLALSFRKGNRHRSLMDAAISVALALGAAGDFRNPILYYIVFLSFLYFTRPKTNEKIGWLQVFLVCTVFLYVTTNYRGLINLISHGFESQEAIPFGNIEYTKVEAGQGDREVHLKFIKPGGISEILAQGYFIRSDDYVDALVRLSLPRNNEPPKGNRTLLPEGNQQYFDEVVETLAFLKSHGLVNDNDTRVATVSFTNPFPFLLDSSLGDEAFHWVHLGTTLAPLEIDQFIRTVMDADIVVVPAKGTDFDWVHTTLNCGFYQANFASGGRFIGVATIGRTLIFASKERRKVYGLEAIFQVPRREMESSCNTLQDAWLALN